MQALHKLALAPGAETTADGNSYGFRESRSCADAIQAGFNALNKPNSAKWIFKKYWIASGRKHIFAVKAKTKKKVDKIYQVVKISTIGIRILVKVLLGTQEQKG